MLLLKDWRKAEKYQSPFPSTESSLDMEVKNLADILKQYGPAFLRNDEHAFDRIAVLRREREQELGPQTQSFNRIKRFDV